MTTPRRGAAAFAAAATLTLVLAACGDDTTSASAGDAPTAATEVAEAHNDADIAFAQGMIPHHRQAVMMSELAEDRTDNPDVLELTEEISAAQEPEIQTMTAFLDAWGADAPMGDASEMPMDDMEGMDHSTMDADDMAGMEGMSGMMTPQQMADLEAAQGAEFDQMFLTMMIEHHEGAVEMANTQLDEGENPDTRALAEDIITAQESEITRMQDLLDAS
ncbi:DUF305 domain-containing protein [Jannaschia sp. R86511]|uniref:DUF305 domain-containing protein n=1 Tax=Jannaschia sp. R86511 TaxID=3093853 RepID=UPI0036D2C462